MALSISCVLTGVLQAAGFILARISHTVLWPWNSQAFWMERPFLEAGACVILLKFLWLVEPAAVALTDEGCACIGCDAFILSGKF